MLLGLFNKSVRVPEQTHPNQAEWQFFATLCFTDKLLRRGCDTLDTTKVWDQKQNYLDNNQNTPVWRQDKPQLTQTKFSHGLVLYFWFSAEKETQPKMMFLLISVTFSAWSDLQRGRERVFWIQKPPQAFYSLVIPVRTHPRWHSGVGWKSGEGSVQPHFSYCSPHPETWQQFLFAEPLHCFLHGFQNTFVYNTPVLFAYTGIEWIIYNENCTNGISALFLFANCLWPNCRSLQRITQKYWQFLIE